MYYLRSLFINKVKRHDFPYNMVSKASKCCHYNKKINKCKANKYQRIFKENLSAYQNYVILILITKYICKYVKKI